MREVPEPHGKGASARRPTGPNGRKDEVRPNEPIGKASDQKREIKVQGRQGVCAVGEC